ncbi:MAG TPA: dihydrolipoyllysine-residue acetyltransferase [Xanthomonadaceae bacterium]|nr:dihydrolipoyllysine-residue acetyltransferase [Xanthomonadaceae bacterium]
MAATQEARVPDIGGFDDVPVIEVLVSAGDKVAKDQGLVTLESDKATMEVPAPFAGVVREVKVKVGDTLSEGGVVALIEAEGEAEGGDGKAAAPSKGDTAKPDAKPDAKATDRAQASEGGDRKRAAETGTRVEPTNVPKEADALTQRDIEAHDGDTDPGEGAGKGDAGGPRTPPVPFDADAVLPDKVPYASPAVRLFARELGVDLSLVPGTARAGRITKEDVQQYVKQALRGGGGVAVPGGGGGGLQLLPWPKVDFSKFGPVQTRELTRIQKISGANLARNWAMIPHVTQHEDADVTELEALRVALNKENEKRIAKGDAPKLTMLAFLMKAAANALREFPDFNASLDADGQTLVLKQYVHVGFAADTPNGLVVPVVRDCDRKGVLQIAEDTAALAARAREGKLGPADMQGGSFTISSLGGIGGTSFTPIVNAPEVAILGVSRADMRPVWDGQAFQPRLVLPLSLSYDHRVIDGASAARFAVHLSRLLGDMRRALL